MLNPKFLFKLKCWFIFYIYHYDFVRKIHLLPVRLYYIFCECVAMLKKFLSFAYDIFVNRVMYETKIKDKLSLQYMKFREYLNFFITLHINFVLVPKTDLIQLSIYNFFRYVYAEIFKRNKWTTLLNSLGVKNYITYIAFIFKLLFKTVYNVFFTLVIIALYYYILNFYFQINCTKHTIIWILFSIFFFFLFSNFNFFINKYKLSKFTTAIQRFWKRTSIVFWLVEGFLFFLFFYFYLNASQEPLYMFDYGNLNQSLTLQLKVTYGALIVLSTVIYLGYLVLVSVNSSKKVNSIYQIIFISLCLYYLLLVETYQFIYLLNSLYSNCWKYSSIFNQWKLVFAESNFRVKQQYFLICLIAKFWHFIFIFISWFFFISKIIENKKISYNLLGYNIQNLIILYFLNLCFLIQWIKLLFKPFLDSVYTNFFITNNYSFYIFLNEFFNIYYSIILSNIKQFTYFCDVIISNNLNCINDIVYWIN